MRGKKSKPEDVFKNTVDDIKMLIRQHEGASGSKKQKKMPLKMYMGVQRKNKERAKEERQFNREANILYNSAGNFVRDATKDGKKGKKERNKKIGKNK